MQRLRVASGFLLLAIFGWFPRPTMQSLAIGISVSVVGLLLRAWAAGHLAKNQDLATTGPYAYVRNPLYAGTLITAAGIVIACRSLLLAIIAAIVFIFVYLPVIELEEQHLAHIFPRYNAYAERVHRLLPLRRWPSERTPFSWSLYRRNKEWKAAAGFAVAVAWMIWKCHSNRG